MMRLLSLFLLLLVLVRAEDGEIGVEEVRSWWLRMSVQQPLKQCQRFFREKSERFVSKETLNKTVLDAQSVFYVAKCMPSEVQKPFTYRGKLVDEKFEGPGKFSVDTTLDSTADISNVCYYNRTLFGVQLRSVVGTFVSGRLEGLAKIDGHDGSVVIAMFKHGNVHGVFRVWRPDHQLRLMGFAYHNVIVGQCWRRFSDDDLMLYNCDDVNKEHEWREGLDEAVVVHNQHGVLIGRDESFHHSVGSLTSGKLVSSESASTSCFLSPTVTDRGDQLLGRYDLRRAKIVTPYNGKSLNTSLCPKDDVNSTQDFLWKWHGAMSQLYTNSLWEMDSLSEQLSPSSTPLLSNIRWEVGRNFSCSLQYSDAVHNFTLLEGQMDDAKRIQGNVKLQFSRDSASKARDPTLDQGYIEIHGYVTNSVFEGQAIVVLEDDRKMRVFFKSNTLHGPTSILGQRSIFPLDPIYKIDNRDSKDAETKAFEVGSLILFKDGKVAKDVPMILFTIGGGFLYFPKGNTTDSNAIYVFPDFETAYVGSFEHAVMKEGRVANVVGHECLPYGLIQLEVELDESHAGDPSVYYSPPTNESLGALPYVRDPYELKQVELRPSNILEAGEGVFALRAIPKGRLICPYVGFEYRTFEESELYHIRHVYNRSLSDELRRWGKKYSINTAYTGAQLNIPPELDNEQGVITMGQKVNCAFDEMKNCGFADVDHPRWGITIGVFATRDIRPGEELLTDYGYGQHPFPMDHPWYHEAKRLFKLNKQKRIDQEKEAEMEKNKKIRKNTKNNRHSKP